VYDHFEPVKPRLRYLNVDGLVLDPGFLTGVRLACGSISTLTHLHMNVGTVDAAVGHDAITIEDFRRFFKDCGLKLRFV